MKFLRLLPAALELAAITLVWGLYLGFFLAAKLDAQDMQLNALSTAMRISGIEHERLSGILIPVEIGLKDEDYRHVPTWNPYLSGGTPLLNNAFNYLFNPFSSLPMLTLGAIQGSKAAIMVGLLLAGYNAWALAKAIGLGGLARVTAGVLYMMSGGIIAKFHTGHFQLGLSLAWPPLVLTGLWWTLRSADRRAPVLMAVAFALLFFAGNIYYTLHTLICAAFITAIHLMDRHDSRWQWRWDRLQRVLIGGAFALGLTALQFLPLWVVREFVQHRRIDFDSAEQLAERYDMTQAVSNYIFPWENWTVFERSFEQIVAVDYAYIGPTVFLLIAMMAAALLLTRERRHQRAGFTAFVLALVMTTWGAAQTPILQFLYTRLPWLSEFRYVGRAHAVASLWWIMLAAIGVDVLWRAARELTGALPTFNGYDRIRLLRVLAIAALLWLFVFAFSVSDNSTRFALALSSPTLYTFLTERAFTTFQQAAEVLWWFILFAIAVDLLLMVGHLAALRFNSETILRMTAARVLRLGLAVLALTATADVMQVNSRLFRYGPPTHNFAPFYADIRAAEPERPHPAVREPFSPSTYDSYYAEMRNFGLDEGWTPRPLPSVIPAGAPRPVILPGWAIVSNEYGGAAYEFSRDYVADKASELIRCQPKYSAGTGDLCNLDNHEGSILYRITDALPYAFVAPEEQILTAADTITNQTVYSARVLRHAQDTVMIRARTPDEEALYYLIVQETPFPGWQAWVDDLPVEPLAVENLIGIRMPPGEHTYTLRYQPPGFSAGVVIFLATIIAVTLYLRNTKRAAHDRATLKPGEGLEA